MMIESVSSAFGQSVRKHRLARGWDQADLAKMLTERGHPVHQTTVSKMEAGVRPTTLAEAVTLAAMFGESLDVMVMGSFKPSPVSALPSATVKALRDASEAIKKALAS